MRVAVAAPLALAAAVAAQSGTPAGRRAADKGLTAQVLVAGGWTTFGTSFADEDAPEKFAPKDEEGARRRGRCAFEIATPRPRRFRVSRGDAAAATWIFRARRVDAAAATWMVR